MLFHVNQEISLSLIKANVNSFGAKFQTTLSSFLTNYRLKRSLYLQLKDGMSNSVDPSGSMLFAKAYYYRLWQ